MTNHGNVAVDPNVVRAYPNSPRISSFDFIGLNSLPSIRSTMGNPLKAGSRLMIFSLVAHQNIITPLTRIY